MQPPRKEAMDAAQRRRLMHRGVGVFALILGLSALANASVMLFTGASLVQEAGLLVPAVILIGLGGWLWWKSRT